MFNSTSTYAGIFDFFNNLTSQCKLEVKDGLQSREHVFTLVNPNRATTKEINYHIDSLLMFFKSDDKVGYVDVNINNCVSSLECDNVNPFSESNYMNKYCIQYWKCTFHFNQNFTTQESVFDERLRRLNLCTKESTKESKKSELEIISKELSNLKNDKCVFNKITDKAIKNEFQLRVKINSAKEECELNAKAEANKETINNDSRNSIKYVSPDSNTGSTKESSGIAK